MRYIAPQRTTALLMLIPYVPGCVTWRPDTQPVPELLANDHPAQIRVTRRDSTRIVLYQPALVGDSVTGSPTRPARAAAPRPYGAALSTDTIAQPADTSGPRCRSPRSFGWTRDTRPSVGPRGRLRVALRANGGGALREAPAARPGRVAHSSEPQLPANGRAAH